MSLAISLQDAAQLLSVEDRTVRNWVHRMGIQTNPDRADGRRRLITDTDLKLLADRFRRPLAPLPQTSYSVTNSSPTAPETSPASATSSATSPDAKDHASAHTAARVSGSTAQTTDQELQRVLKSLDLLMSEVSDMRAKVDLLVQTTLAPGAQVQHTTAADDPSAETRPLRHTNELMSAGG